MTTRPARVWAEVTGGNALGRGQQPALSWWLPEGCSVQHAYQVRTDDGYDTGRVEGAIQSFVRLPVFDRSRRSALAQVKVWTDLGESAWSDHVRLESGLLGEQDWHARWIGVEEAERPEQGSRPAYWLRTLIDVPPAAEARLYLTALGLYEAFLDGSRVGDAVHDLSFDDRTWREAVARDVDVTIVRSVAPPVRRVQEIRPAAVRPVRGPGDGTDAFVADFGQNFSGWVRLERPAGGRVTLTHGEWLDRDGDLTTRHLDVDLPIFPERLPLGQVDEVVPAGNGDVFEPRFTTHGFRYVRIQGQPGPFGPNDITGVVVHSDLRRLGWFSCSDERVSRLHEAVVWSLRSNMCDIPTDCPQRERAGWTGDWQIFAPTAAYLYDVLAFTRKWLGDVALDQRADGCVANISPCPPAEAPGPGRGPARARGV